jgi:hypothetical protein
MELASILAGERFSDRPKSVCPLIGAILRSFNDHIGDERRQDLYRFAAQAVGTRGDFVLQHERAAVALDVARDARAEAPRGKRLPEPAIDAGPEQIAEYVVESMAVRAYSRYRSRRWDDASHEKMISLLDRLIGMGGSAFDALLGELVEESAAAVRSSSSPNSARAARKRGSNRARRSSTRARPRSVRVVRTTRRSLSERVRSTRP